MHYLSASLQLVGAFHIYLLCTPECHCLLEGSLHMAGAPFFMSGNPAFAATTQETPLSFLTVGAKRVHILGALELITRDSVLSRLPLWGHHTDSGLKRSSCPSEKEVHVLAQDFDPEGWVSGLALLWRPMELLSGNTSQWLQFLHSPPLHHPASSFRKNHILFSGALTFAAKRHFYIAQFLWPTRLMLVGSTGC